MPPGAPSTRPRIIYRDIFENCAWGVFQTTADGRYITANPALARIYGYATPEELLAPADQYRRPALCRSRAPRRFRAGDDAITASCTASNRRSIAATARSSGSPRPAAPCAPAPGACSITRARSRTSATASAPRPRPAARPTRPRPRSRALEAANLDLERRVAERTAELRAMQDELLLKERLSTLGKLTATVAHELRNPLSAIRNSMHVVRGAAEPATAPLDRAMGADRPLRRALRRDHRRPHRLFARAQARVPRHPARRVAARLP